MSKQIVLDLETDGLIDEATRIWCATFNDAETGSFVSFIPDNVKGVPGCYPIGNLRFFLNKRIDLGYTWICHNLLKFDREIIERFTGILLPLEYCQDTLLWSQMLYPDIPQPKGAKGKHGLEAWGLRFNIPKPAHEDWTKFSLDMLNRNQVDTQINRKLWLKIMEKI